MSALTVLVVTQWEPHTAPFLRAASNLADDLDAAYIDAAYIEWDGTQAECIEETLDDAVAFCPDGHILRLDDDERCSPEMVDWLMSGDWQFEDHWAFPRMNLFGDEQSWILTPPLWPDYQTRLSTKEKSGGRRLVHQGSPFGTGVIAPCAIEHHKFLVRSEAERRQLVSRYESLQPGAGSAFVPFSLPEALNELSIATRVAA